MKYFISILLLTFLSLTSCRYDNEFANNFSSVFGIGDFETALEEVGEYAIFGARANGAILIKNSSSSTNGEEHNVSYVFASFMPDMTQQSVRTDVGVFRINDQEWVFEDDKYVNPELERGEIGENALSLFGKDVDLSLVRNGQTIVAANFRAPEYLHYFEISNTEIIDPISPVRWLDKNESTMYWNSDPLNKNGVLLVLTSQKDVVGEISHGQKQTYYKVFFVQDDDGTEIIPSSFFEGFNSEETIILTLYRGKFDFIGDDGAGNSYKFYALADVKAHFAIK